MTGTAPSPPSAPDLPATLEPLPDAPPELRGVELRERLLHGLDLSGRSAHDLRIGESRLDSVERSDVESMTPRLTGHDLSLDAPRSLDDRRQLGALIAEDAPNPEDVVAGVEESDSRRTRLVEGLKVTDRPTSRSRSSTG